MEEKLENRPMQAPALQLLSLTFIGVFLEIASCVWGVFHQLPIWSVPLVLGGYHSGYLLARLPHLAHIRGQRLLLCISLGMVALGMLMLWWPLVTIGLLIFSTTLQNLRRFLKRRAKINSRIKNSAKVLAMLVGSAGALPQLILALIIVFISVACLIIVKIKPEEDERKTTNFISSFQHSLLWFELLHHAHYFAYCYTFWALLNVGLFPFIGPLFIIGWIGYFISEWLFRERFRVFSIKTIVLGHLLCAGALAAMLSSTSSLVILLLWLITGVGGGTAYMLGNTPNTGNRELYEDVGHIIGCFGATVVILFTRSPDGSISLGIVLACSAAVVLLLGASRLGKSGETAHEEDQSDRSQINAGRIKAPRCGLRCESVYRM